MIETKGYMIGNQGDDSVGIQPQWYRIEGDFLFEDEKEQVEFEKLLIDTFELICDPVFIYSFEEIEELNSLP